MSNPYGLGQGVKPQGFIGVLAGRVKQGRSVDLWGDGKIVRDFVHVSDAAAAFERVSAGHGAPGAYNIGSSVGRSLLEVIGMVEKLLDRPVLVNRLPGRPVDVAVNVLDITKARKELSWEPRVPLEKGLRGLFFPDR
jgi:UDP-glucose 4-epimerase